MFSKSMLVASLGFCITHFAVAEAKAPKASEQTQCKFQDHTSVTVEYGSMKLNGRKVFGGVVPYGRVWETGYKRSPMLVTDANLVVGGKEVPAGHYSIVTIPNPDMWTMVVKKVPGADSTGTDAVAKIDLTVRRLPSPLEDFTISFQQLQNGCVLNLRWEATEASVLVAQKK